MPHHYQDNRHYSDSRKALPGTGSRLANVTLRGHRQVVHDEFMSRGGTSRAGFQLKWLASTAIAGAVGIIGILAGVYTSLDNTKDASIFAALQHQGQKSFEIFRPVVHKEAIYSKKGDREVSKGESISYTIHDSEVQERNGREFIATRPYIKVMGKLATYRINARTKIPAFNPFRLYADLKPLSAPGSNSDNVKNSAVTVEISSLSPLKGRYAFRNSSLTATEIGELTALAGSALLEKVVFRPARLAGSTAGKQAAEGNRSRKSSPILDDRFLKNATTIAKNSETYNIMDDAKERIVKVKSGETLSGILGRLGTTGRQRHKIIKAMAEIYPAHKINVGQNLHFTLLPVARNATRLEPVRMSLHNSSNTRHLITVSLNAGGTYVGSKKKVSTLFMKGRKYTRNSHTTLYSSIYESAAMLNLPKKEIIKLLRLHAFGTDYKRKARPADRFQAFYVANKDRDTSTNRVSDLLYTSIFVGGEKRAYYRFRLPDGTIDYYDSGGKSAKKFLLLKPVRSARLTSGFGYRYHPILKKRKLHQGIDWAGVPIGTPILAAGNGTVEVARPAGGYGNYVRIRHANGYKSAYAHMVRFAKGMKKGIKVRQGQVIGYLGNTGRSTGAHLHFEILVNNKRVNPMAINVPSGRNLTGKLAMDFMKERDRIDTLMRKSPVKTRIASAG